MATKLVDLAKDLDITPQELRVKLHELGFETKAAAKIIDDDIAELIRDEFRRRGADEASAGGSAEGYEHAVERQIEREIVRSQRKKMAGKDVSKDARRDGAAGGAVIGRGSIVEIPDLITVKEFAEKIAQSPARIIGELMKNGIVANINQEIDFETASIIAQYLGIELKRKRGSVSTAQLYEGDLSVLIKEDNLSALPVRPPVVVIMGHVDHGKTTLLDYIRHAKVAASESGGITQHIGAYQVETNGRKITFLDTPGHEAFTAMRARGAKVTDIAVLVVAADEGIKPQTIEALNHAKDAGVPIIVALNKMDKPGVQPDRVIAQLAEHGLQPEEWGGTTVYVKLSALTGMGVDTLLEMILLSADMLNLRANPHREAIGTVVEAHLDTSLGPVATIIVNTGTLHLMDTVVVGTTSGRIKLMRDHTGATMHEAGPSTPVFIAGMSETPQSGDILHVVPDEKAARAKALQVNELRVQALREKAGGLQNILSLIQDGVLKTLKIVLKADSQGSLEAIQYALGQVATEDVSVKVIHAGVGNISDGDVMMASASGGLVIGFHVAVPTHVKQLAEREGVEIANYMIIYQLLDDLKNLLSGLLEPEVIETFLGRAEVKQVFFTKNQEQIVGCRVLSGKIENKAKLRVWRGETQVGEGDVASLKFIDKVVSEINEGNECGVKYLGTILVQAGDVLECYKVERKKRTLA